MRRRDMFDRRHQHLNRLADEVEMVHEQGQPDAKRRSNQLSACSIINSRVVDVSFGSWLCENAKTRNRGRRS
jgi:hypothetical protein